MAQKYTKFIISLFFLLTIIFIACEDSKKISNNSTISKNNIETEMKPIPGLPPDIPSFPHIFEGKAYISGQTIPDGSKIYAKLGELDSPIVESKNGEFKNLIIGPRSKEDIENNIEFFIIKDDGSSMKANEEIPFEITPVIKSNILNLNFK
tara:strand:- start:512 stop:964 length:453 start_codon:yes stop_codon:yes gene_type:complete